MRTDGAARAEAKLALTMPSRDRGRRSQRGKDAKRLNPFGSAFGFEAQLVEGDVVNQPVEPFVEC